MGFYSIKIYIEINKIMKKLLFIICCIVSVSKNANSQVISVEGVSHADTVQFADPFDITCWFVNTGNTLIFSDSITANIAIHPVNTSPNNWDVLSITQSISFGTVYPGDSIFMLNTFLQGGSQLFQQAGDNLVVIWPSFVVPISSDTSITPLYVLPPIASVNELNYPIYEESDNFIYDLLGRRYYNINTLIKGTIFIRDGKKYIKK